MGGIETMLVNIANAQAAMGCDVHIVVVNRHYDESLIQRIDPAVKFLLLNRRPGSRRLIPLIRLNAYLLRHRAAVIHCHVGSLIGIIARPFHCRCCLTRHSVSSQQDQKKRLGRYRKVFAISEAVKQDIWQKYQIPSIVIPNGILTGEIKKREYRHIDKDSTVRLVSVGRILLSVKGQDILCRAVARLQAYKIALDIIGDGPDMDQLSQLCSDLGLNGSVRLMGRRTPEYLSSHLREYDMFVLPSLTEGFGLSVAEAMAAMLPVVVSDIEGPREIVCGGRYGHLFKAGDIDGCASAIQSVIEHYDTEASLDEAYRHIVESYDVKQTARRYLEQY